MILVDVANGKQRHVPYRDSKLTFLLQVSFDANFNFCVYLIMMFGEDIELDMEVIVLVLHQAHRMLFVADDIHRSLILHAAGFSRRKF